MDKNLEILLCGSDAEFHKLLQELNDRKEEQKSTDRRLPIQR